MLTNKDINEKLTAYYTIVEAINCLKLANFSMGGLEVNDVDYIRELLYRLVTDLIPEVLDYLITLEEGSS